METYYKVLLKEDDRLVGGYSHFNYRPSLPKGRRPGKWLKIPDRKKLCMCFTGFHVTTSPNSWGADYKSCYGVYSVEIKGETLSNGGDKICCRQIRLLCRVINRGGKWVTSGYWRGTTASSSIRSASIRISKMCAEW